MTQPKKPIWEKVRELVESVGLPHTVLDGIAASFLSLAGTAITTSATLRIFLVVFGIAGAVLGYFRTAWLWKGVSKEKRVKRAKGFLIGVVLSLLAFLVLLGIVGPDLTGQYSWVESIREVVIAVDLVPNILLGVAIGLASFFLVSSISIISPKMTKGA